MITLEDINTWMMTYDNQTLVFTLDCDKPKGDYGLFRVNRVSLRMEYITLFLPADDVKLYYPSGGLSYNESTDQILLTDGDYQLTVILTLNSKYVGGNTKFRELDWHPVSPTKCLRLPNDNLKHRKLYLKINDSRITSINYHNITDRGTDNPYITYGDVYAYGSADILWSNIDEGSRYSFKMITIPSCPHITPIKSLYRGNNNSLTDLIDLPLDEIEYSIYYQGKKLDEDLFIPREYSEDSIRLRVVTKSYEPYVGTDVFIDVPVETKLLTTIEDLNTYNYGCIDLLEDITGEINNDIIIVKQDNTSGLSHCNLTINGNVEFRDLQYIEQTLIINNSNLKITDADINSKYHTGFEWVNNGTLTLDNVTIHTPSGFILNNNKLVLVNSVITDKTRTPKNLPVIHSTTNDYIITDNTFEFNQNSHEGYNICIIRCNDFDANTFIAKNNLVYDCNYTYDDSSYHITGSGVAYCEIDKDTIIFNNLEVE